MSSTGVTVDDSCLNAFQELKSKREINTVVYRLSEPSRSSLVVEGEANMTHEEMMQSLPADEPRFVVYDLHYASADGSRRNDPVLIFWTPERALPALELAYSSAYGVLRDVLDSVHFHVRATALSHLAYDELVAQAA